MYIGREYCKCTSVLTKLHWCACAVTEWIHCSAHCCQEESDGHCQYACGAWCSNWCRIQGWFVTLWYCTVCTLSGAYLIGIDHSLLLVAVSLLTLMSVIYECCFSSFQRLTFEGLLAKAGKPGRWLLKRLFVCMWLYEIRHMLMEVLRVRMSLTVMDCGIQGHMKNQEIPYVVHIHNVYVCNVTFSQLLWELGEHFHYESYSYIVALLPGCWQCNLVRNRPKFLSYELGKSG